jgi:hypothetical protein
MQSTTEINNDASTKVKKTATKTKKPKTTTETNETQEQASATVEETSTKKEEVSAPVTAQPATTDAVAESTIEASSGDADISQEYIEIFSDLEKFIEKAVTFNKNFKDYKFESKDAITQLCSINKNLSKVAVSLSTNIVDILQKESISSFKAKGAKKNKKDKAPKDKKNFAVNQEFEPLPYVLKFMELPESSLVSKGMIIQKVNSFVKTEKTAKNPDIFVEGNNRKFKVIGDLKKFFSEVHLVMKSRNATPEGEPFPTELAYTDIMKYLKYCFPEAAPK